MSWNPALAALWLAILVLLAPQPASAGPTQPRRLALIVGNVDYVNLPVLTNVTADVISVRQKLEAMHFDVVVPPQRASADEFTLLDLAPFQARIQPGDIVVVYYSGHGFSYGSDNFIVPIGAPTQVAQSEVQFTFTAEASIRSFLQSRHPAFLLMLMDTCRSRPGFVRDGISSGLEKGYTMPQRPPEDVSITSAVAPGFAASAGPAGGRSVFTEALAANMAVPGDELSVLQAKITYQMRQAGSQDPWVAENRVTRLWLQTSPAVDEEARTAWERARDSGLRTKVEEYLAWYATGPYAADARSWLEGNQAAAVPRPAAVAPVAVDLAWQDAITNNAAATAETYDGLQVSRVQSLGPGAGDLAQLRRDLAVDPFAMSTNALATRSLGNGSIKKGAMVNLWSGLGRTLDIARFSALLASLRTSVRLGTAKTERFLTPDTQGSGATVQSDQVAAALAAARAGGQQISWVSIATARGQRSVTVARGLMATQAAALIAKAGVPVGQITTVEGVPETFEGVRLRIFTR